VVDLDESLYESAKNWSIQTKSRANLINKDYVFVPPEFRFRLDTLMAYINENIHVYLSRFIPIGVTETPQIYLPYQLFRASTMPRTIKIASLLTPCSTVNFTLYTCGSILVPMPLK
jgi:hypothetical protein